MTELFSSDDAAAAEEEEETLCPDSTWRSGARRLKVETFSIPAHQLRSVGFNFMTARRRLHSVLETKFGQLDGVGWQPAGRSGARSCLSTEPAGRGLTTADRQLVALSVKLHLSVFQL